jgi:L-aspartate oxidase
MSAHGGARRLNVVIVGSGVAGLVTALALGDRHDVTIVTKSTIDESNTRYAQGGIAAAVMPGDSVASHVADTLAAGAGLSDAAAVRVLCEEGPERIRDLIRWGVEFDRQSDDQFADFDAGLEGAHSFHRILHAGGDATGYEVEWALVRAVRASAVRVLEQAFVMDVIVNGGQATGLVVRHEGGLETLTADAVVLASGGIGQLYPHTTNPSVTTGDGAAAALRAGAVLADVEFVQFHPTALAAPGSFLVSEAVRGDGAVLRNARGERFMLTAHPMAELAPRDVVARAIASEMTSTGAPVVLDATAIGAEELERRFPTISAASRAHGFDWSREPVPVAPAAHYWMGGVATDLDGRTSVPGLFAVGEVSCTGVHGANRLASNSLLESLVFAHRAAAAIDADALRGAPAVWRGLPNLVWGATDAGGPEREDAGDGSRGGEGARDGSGGGTGARDGSGGGEAAGGGSGGGTGARDGSGGGTAAWVATGFGGPERERAASGDLTTGARHEPTRAELHAVMWQHAGVHRAAEGLRAAQDALGGWDIRIGDPATATVERLETANLLQLARVIVDAALAREESRGAHFRADFPDLDPRFAHHLAVAVPTAVPAVSTSGAPATADAASTVTSGATSTVTSGAASTVTSDLPKEMAPA